MKKGQAKTITLVEETLGSSLSPQIGKLLLAFTERGVKPSVEITNRADWKMAVFAFRMIALDADQYIADFQSGLLFLVDFNDSSTARKELAAAAYRTYLRRSARANIHQYYEPTHFRDWLAKHQLVTGVS